MKYGKQNRANGPRRSWTGISGHGEPPGDAPPRVTEPASGQKVQGMRDQSGDSDLFVVIIRDVPLGQAGFSLSILTDARVGCQ